MSRSSANRARVAVSRAISLIVAVVVLIIVVGILLIVLEANPDNDIVSTVIDVAQTLVGPFDDLFTLDDRKAQIGVNWGIAAVVYLILGRILGSIVHP